MLSWKWTAPVVVALAIMLAVNVSTPKPAEAFIDEMIAAFCNGDPAPGVVPRGQVREGTASFVRALQATGFIESIDGNLITFDPTVPSSKVVEHTGHGDHGDAGNPDQFPIPGGLIGTPHFVFDVTFPAFANCPLFNP